MISSNPNIRSIIQSCWLPLRELARSWPLPTLGWKQLVQAHCLVPSRFLPPYWHPHVLSCPPAVCSPTKSQKRLSQKSSHVRLLLQISLWLSTSLEGKSQNSCSCLKTPCDLAHGNLCPIPSIVLCSSHTGLLALPQTL